MNRFLCAPHIDLKPNIALLVENKHDIPKVAELLGRTEDACREKIKRLKIPIKNVPKGTYIIFPNADLRS